MNLNELLENLNGKPCSCGKKHIFNANVFCGKNALLNLPVFIKNAGAKKAFILADKNTFAVAGEKVSTILFENGIKHSSYVFSADLLEPDERSVGSAVMNYDRSSDVIIAIGSGVINDIGKILSALSGKPYVIVGTAPSMDGYASATSSMNRDGVKVSLPTKYADCIIGDTDILKTAPIHMFKSGLGDMLAKYVSICEWRIANLLLGEYYCETVADTVRQALKKCIDNRHGLLNKDDDAVEAVFEGLVIGGIAMAYAGVSRPASGVEHYLSHIWDMRGMEFNTPCDLHGIQCAVGTLISARIYEKVKAISPDKEKALSYVKNFSTDLHNTALREFLGSAAEPMISLEKKEGKYSVEKHAVRLEVILERWDDVLKIIEDELPSAEKIEGILDDISAPKTLAEIGLSEDILPMTFKASKDIRDKYVLSRLTFDLGIIDDIFTK